jgi:CheY-like chemotaxis protein
VLQREDLEIVEAGDGTSALALARSDPPDLILLDLHIPGISGEDVLAELKADPATAGARVIVVTATGEEGRARALAVGADAYFTKPFSPIALLQAVEQARGGPAPPGS